MSKKLNIDINKAILMYENGSSTKQIANLFNCSDVTIQNRLRLNNIKLRTASENARRYKVNESFFRKIDTPEKAYILGFIFADGYNYRNDISKDYKLKIRIHPKDINLLETFRILLESEKPVYVENQTNGYKPGEPIANLTICSKKLSDDLLALGVTNTKSSIEVYPLISGNLHSHFIRGYFDGDGCIYFSDEHPRIEILATYEFCNSIKDILLLNDIRSHINEKHKFIYRLRISKKTEVVKFLNYIYKDTTLHLDRKYSRSFPYLSK